MKRESRWRRFGGAFLLAGFISLGRPAVIPAQELNLIPEPKQVERREGAFRVGPGVRIVLAAARSREDRTAAEMLAEEVHAATGRRLSITAAGASELPSGVIYLARLGDSPRLRGGLESKGLRADEHLDPEGYLLDADSRHIWVAGTTGQGCFTGYRRCGNCYDRANRSGQESNCCARR